MIKSTCTWILLAVLAAAPAMAADQQEELNWLAQATEMQEKGVAAAPAAEPAGFQKPIPVSFSIEYTLVTDYMFRGINFSEYRGEGREALNHQLAVGTEVDLGDFGVVGGGVWFEWYADQQRLTPNSGSNLQEVDYFVYYGYTIEQLGLDLEVGFTWYLFPRLSSDADTTQEIYLNVGWDDSMLWNALGMNVDGPILNPYFYSAWDLDLAKGGSYHEFGFSHDFAIGDYTDAAILKDVTVTPSWAMGFDHNWAEKLVGDDNGNFGNNGLSALTLQYGLNVSLDLKSVFGIPDMYASELYLNGFLNYNQALADHVAGMDDNLWGGMSVGYSW